MIRTTSSRLTTMFARQAQFARYLRLTGDRARNEAHQSSFMIIEQHPPDTSIVPPRDKNATWNRFVQYSFEADFFCLDLPVDTLRREEAKQILRDRTGFFWLRERPEFRLYHEDVQGHDPFRKVYHYGDEPAAAQDAAYLFFTLWRLPTDSRLYVSAAPFGGSERWEYGKPI